MSKRQRIQFALSLLTVGVIGAAVLLAIRAKDVGGVKFVTPKDGVECLIVNRHSGRCLSVTGGVAKPGAKVVQGPAPEKAGPVACWVLRRAGPRYKVVHRDTGLVLEIAGARAEHGGLAMLWTDSGAAPHQEWTLAPVGAAHTLRAGHSALYLAVAQSSQKDGATVLQWDRVDAADDDQLWFLLPPV